MNILLGILASYGCWATAIKHAPDYIVFSILNSDDSKIPYPILKALKRTYKLMSLILLNLFCFISQFFVLSNDLKFVFFTVNIIFFLNVFLDIFIDSYNKNYIALLQEKIVSPVKITYLFDVETNAEMPNDYKNNGIYLLIKGKIYYKDDTQSICLSPKKFGLKKSPLNLGEIKYIISKLNENNTQYNDDLDVLSFYKYPDLYLYSDYFVFDEIKNNSFRKKIYKIIHHLSEIFNTIFVLLYFLLGSLSLASIFGSNICPWFTL